MRGSVGGMGLEVDRKNSIAVAEQDLRLLVPFLKRLLRSRGIVVIRPKLSHDGNGRVIYPEADKLLGTRGVETVRILDLIESMGVLKKALLEVVRVCASCGSASLEFREKCAACGKEFAVSYTARIECPHCRNRLDGAEGVIVCRRCGASFDPSNGKELPLYMYVLAESEAEGKEVGEVGVEEAGAEPLSSEMKRFIAEFGEKLNTLLEQYMRAKPMYYVSPETSVREAGDVRKIELAPHLAKTYQVLRNKGRVTALDVSVETGRSRSLESVYLNQLVALGLASKQRVRRKLYFVLRESG